MPGLDGVRALAVAAVFAYHAEAGWLPGGFLGVDVFFVVSGYLISSLLISERERAGLVSLSSFWRRRARRLAPALAPVLGLTLLAGAVVDPAQISALRGEALAGLFFFANWHDALSHVSYFAQFGRPPLLRQLWSLAVEEQFYLLWPPLLVVALAHRRLDRVAQLALVIAVASGVEMALLAGSHSATRIYEGTDTRAQTLLVGALAAALMHPSRLVAPRRRVPPAVLDLAGVACAIGLGAMMVTVNGQTAGLFRGPLQASGILAAGVVLAAAQPTGIVSRLLSARPLRWIGQRSYGIYLWHWPVIALLRSPRAGYGQSLGLTALDAAVTLALAGASYAWLEQPVRRHGFRAALRLGVQRLERAPAPLRAATVVGVAGLAMACFVIALTTHTAGEPRADAAPRALEGTVTARSPLPLRGGIREHPPIPHSPSRRAVAAPVPTLVFGDSVVLGVAPALAARLGPRTRFDAVVGRQPQDTVVAVADTRAEGGLPSRLIISLGDNGIVTPAMLRRLRQVVAGVPDVVLVTPRVPDPWGVPSADAIRAAAHWWPQVRIADWQRLSANENGWFTDGVHPDAVGVRRFVALVAKTVGEG